MSRATLFPSWLIGSVRDHGNTGGTAGRAKGPLRALEEPSILPCFVRGAILGSWSGMISESSTVATLTIYGRREGEGEKAGVATALAEALNGALKLMTKLAHLCDLCKMQLVVTACFSGLFASN
jgi:hypothetical protein